MIITENQKREIVALIPKYKSALVAYGADIYRQGLIKGALLATFGIGVGLTVRYVIQK